MSEWREHVFVSELTGQAYVRRKGAVCGVTISDRAVECASGRAAWVAFHRRAAEESVGVPRGPSDAEIVRAWSVVGTGEEVANGRRLDKTRPLSWTGGNGMHSATYAQYVAARSRELQRRQDEAREVERQRVVIDWGVEGDDVETGLVELCDPFAGVWR